jgi:uncharacterized membrane protein YidH (DUF202 family)
MTRARQVAVLVPALVPIAAALVLLQIVEPFPRGWLDPDNPHFWANILRVVAFVLGVVSLGLIYYVMVKATMAESALPEIRRRKKLYDHLTLVACGVGLVVVAVLFYIRSRIDESLSLATPFVLAGLIVTGIALWFMLQYENQRILRHHRELEGDDPADGGESVSKETNENSLQQERDVKQIAAVAVLFVIVVAAFLLQLIAYLDSQEALKQSRQNNKELRRTNDDLKAVVKENRRLALLGKQSHDAHCQRRFLLVSDIRRTRALLRGNPDTVFGIPASLIRAGLRDDETLLRALSSLDCRGVPPLQGSP